MNTKIEKYNTISRGYTDNNKIRKYQYNIMHGE